ncbi:MAG: hypothetical protein ACREEB_11920 [Caulobacteraceae bacterium]
MSLRIAMWSGPRNISTAMMRAFENRPDTEVIDEPFYAAYLIASGADHPLRAEVLAAHETNPGAVAKAIAGDAPGGAAIFYQKHMTHHLLAGFDRGWMERCRHAFLIRAPERVLASYAKRRAEVTLEDIGFVQQGEIYDEVARTTGASPPVIDAEVVLANPKRALGALCIALGIPFDEAMLSWPAGRRPGDGAWAPAWYEAVERSTGFAPPSPPPALLEPRLAAIADAARPIYERLARYRI